MEALRSLTADYIGMRAGVDKVAGLAGENIKPLHESKRVARSRP